MQKATDGAIGNWMDKSILPDVDVCLSTFVSNGAMVNDTNTESGRDLTKATDTRTFFLSLECI